ncbi:MAG: DUF4097 family beta strand repeat-containing protein [Gammaproteobacteria bacterium]|nr:DUF4097 family beta strand repeat-containing protein [Gammaproteobacteria bacterium]
MYKTNTHTTLAFGLLACLALAAGPVLADETVRDKRSQVLAGADALEVVNLMGQVSLEPAAGKDFEIEATVVATADNAAEASRIAGLISLQEERWGGGKRILTRYPVDDYDVYVYSDDRHRGYNVSTGYQGERVNIRSSGRGLDVHVDYVIKVPAGASVRFENKIGTISATNVNGDLDLDTASGPIKVEGGEGETRADTGSGSVDIRDRRGDVMADTGSGAVLISGILGDVEADTGSGGVEVSAVEGRVEIDTGSGGATLDAIQGDIHIDTGSGGVIGRGLLQVKELYIDTGSGRVDLEGDFSTVRDLEIDTGSGGVKILTSSTLNMELYIETGSGGARVELPEMSNVRTDRGEFSARIGNGEGRGYIDTGSGGVRILSR